MHYIFFLPLELITQNPRAQHDTLLTELRNVTSFATQNANAQAQQKVKTQKSSISKLWPVNPALCRSPSAKALLQKKTKEKNRKKLGFFQLKQIDNLFVS